METIALLKDILARKLEALSYPGLVVADPFKLLTFLHLKHHELFSLNSKWMSLRKINRTWQFLLKRGWERELKCHMKFLDVVGFFRFGKKIPKEKHHHWEKVEPIFFLNKKRTYWWKYLSWKSGFLLLLKGCAASKVKLSSFRPGQFLDGRLLGHSRCCWHGFGY